MTEKIKSEIISIDLTEASYKNNHAHIEPTFVNFFFGNNGAGKSTVAKAIKSGTGLTYASGKTAEDYLVLVYNQEFIDDNFRSYRNMRGVFTLNAHNAAIQAQIDEKTEERKTVKAAHTAASTGYDKTKEDIDNLTKAFYNECWKRGKTIKEEFPKTQSGKGRMELFANAITAHEPKEIDIEELRRLYDSAFSDNRRRYDRFSPVMDTTELDSVPGSDILAKAIVNSANTELAVFLKTIGATEWAKEGHEMYSSTSAGKCPYCGQSLPEDFEKKFIEVQDDMFI